MARDSGVRRKITPQRRENPVATGERRVLPRYSTRDLSYSTRDLSTQPSGSMAETVGFSEDGVTEKLSSGGRGPVEGGRKRLRVWPLLQHQQAPSRTKCSRGRASKTSNPGALRPPFLFVHIYFILSRARFSGARERSRCVQLERAGCTLSAAETNTFGGGACSRSSATVGGSRSTELRQHPSDVGKQSRMPTYLPVWTSHHRLPPSRGMTRHLNFDKPSEMFSKFQFRKDENGCFPAE